MKRIIADLKIDVTLIDKIDENHILSLIRNTLIENKIKINEIQYESIFVIPEKNNTE